MARPTKECATTCPYRLALMEIWSIGNEEWDRDIAIADMWAIANDILFGWAAPVFEEGIGLGEK